MGRVILASNSPRRRELLGEIIKDFDVVAADIDESRDPSASPEEIAEDLATKKCRKVSESASDGDIVIGCDTIVVFDGEILGKPRDEADAERMLRLLSGKSHEVLTGVCVSANGKEVISHEATEVTFRDLDDDFIRAYIESGSPMDKAGAYGIQDGDIVKSYKGSYSNVVGFPQELVRYILEELRA